MDKMVQEGLSEEMTFICLTIYWAATACHGALGVRLPEWKTFEHTFKGCEETSQSRYLWE